MYAWGVLDFQNEADHAATAEAPKLAFPVRIPELPSANPPTSFACGRKHAVAIFDGVLYGFGNNSSNQLGPIGVEHTHKYLKLTAFHSRVEATPIEVVCGAKTTLVRCIDGSVHSVGDNTFGQRAHNSEKNWNQVPFPGPVDSIVVGGDSCFALSAGSVWSWGRMEFGSLGHGTSGAIDMVTSGAQDYSLVRKPMRVEWFANQKLRILQVAAGVEHMVARTDTDVYCVGSGSYMKLGTGDIADVLLPKRVVFPERKYPEKLVQVAAGGFQTACLKISSQFGSIVYTWGRIGDDADGDRMPRVITEAGANVERIFLGRFCVSAVTSDGTLHMWGTCPNVRNVGLHYGAPSRRYPCPVSCMAGKFVTAVASGPSFFLAVTDDKKMTAPSTTVDVVVPLEHRFPKPDHDVAVLSYFTRFFDGDSAVATAVFERIPKPSPLKEAPKYQRRGASKLHKGSKVRVFMTDVYALGTVVGIDERNKNSFEIRWLRDDWDPETVELYSDDEGTDDTNPNRWQALWYLELPKELVFNNT